MEMKLRFGDGCVHPFRSVQAIAIEQSDPEPDGTKEFRTTFKCLRCGHVMFMISKGRKASKEEEKTLRGEHEPKRESSEPG